MTETKFQVEGMKCQGCVDNVEKALTQVSGLTSTNIELEQGIVTVAGDVDPQSVCRILTEAGYPAVVNSA